MGRRIVAQTGGNGRRNVPELPSWSQQAGVRLSHMTVAAILLVPDMAAALADADGEPAIRRVAHAAWSGGALPTIVVTEATDAALVDALAGLPVTITRPGPDEPRVVAWFIHGQRAARSAVGEATAGLLWPIRYAWVDPETVTSLVESHGTDTERIVRPAFLGSAGFPILIPATADERLAALPNMPAGDAVDALGAAGFPCHSLELGDPGIVSDISTPRAGLPEYQGPPRPAAPTAEGLR